MTIGPALAPNVAAPIEGLLRADGVVVADIGPDDVVVTAGTAQVRLRGPGCTGLLAKVVALADGSRTIEQLLAEFDEDQARSVRPVVTGLVRRGILYAAQARSPAEQFWHTVADYVHEPGTALASARVLVHGDPELAEPLRHALRACGVLGASTGLGDGPATTADLRCAAVVGPPHGPLLEWADQALADRATFLPVWLHDLTGHVGPLTFPRESACLRCYLLRVDANDEHLDAHRSLRAHGPGRPAGHLPPMAQVLAQVAALEVVKHLTGLPSSVSGHVLDIGFVPFAARGRRVLKVPRCPSCSGVARRGAPELSTTPQLRD